MGAKLIVQMEAKKTRLLSVKVSTICLFYITIIVLMALHNMRFKIIEELVDFTEYIII